MQTAANLEVLEINVGLRMFALPDNQQPPCEEASETVWSAMKNPKADL